MGCPTQAMIAQTSSNRIGPVFRHLTAFECGAVLANNSVGRLAFTFHGRVDIEPLHYVVNDGWLYFRTQPGSKVTMLAHHPWAALEVDEIESAFNWRSVVVHGVMHILTDAGTALERARYEDAVNALHAAAPASFTARDPVSFRSLILGMHIAETTGRAANWAADPSR